MTKRTKENNKKKRRVGVLEEIKNRYYIFSEGSKTEPHYFNGFKRAIESNPVYKNSVRLITIGTSRETINVVKEAEKYVRRNSISQGEIWCLYDKDDFPGDQFNAASKYVDSLNANLAGEDLQYYAAWSNECIEYWFVLHFSYYTSNNHRSQLEKYLDAKFKEKGNYSYEKNDPDIFDKLLNIGNPKKAIEFAERQIQHFNGYRDSDSAPATKVHCLVRQLATYLPLDKKIRFI